MAVCRSCGVNNTGGSLTCFHCGESLIEAALPPSPASKTDFLEDHDFGGIGCWLAGWLGYVVFSNIVSVLFSLSSRGRLTSPALSFGGIFLAWGILKRRVWAYYGLLAIYLLGAILSLASESVIDFAIFIAHAVITYLVVRPIADTLH
jgi:hypothetical protein